LGKWGGWLAAFHGGLASGLQLVQTLVSFTQWSMGEPVQLMEGRFDAYLTDSLTNASLPQGADPATPTLPKALELLAARAALGPPAKKAGRKKAKAAAPKAEAKAAKPKKAAQETL